MANDISYFKVQGDDTQYSFNDADLESRIGAEEMGTEAQTITGAVAELAGKVGTLSNLTTDEQDNLVEAINEVDAHADTNASNIATNTSNIATNASNIATNTAAISQLNSKTVLSLTRMEQSWVNETDFARLYAMKRGNMLHLRGNLCVTYGSGFSGDFQQIGTINGWNAASEVYINVPMQNDGSKVVAVQILTSGVIKIYSSTEFSGKPFFRFNVCVPCA